MPVRRPGYKRTTTGQRESSDACKSRGDGEIPHYVRDDTRVGGEAVPAFSLHPAAYGSSTSNPRISSFFHETPVKKWCKTRTTHSTSLPSKVTRCYRREGLAGGSLLRPVLLEGLVRRTQSEKFPIVHDQVEPDHAPILKLDRRGIVPRNVVPPILLRPALGMQTLHRSARPNRSQTHGARLRDPSRKSPLRKDTKSDPLGAAICCHRRHRSNKRRAKDAV